jgi:hypothetical protein
MNKQDYEEYINKIKNIEYIPFQTTGIENRVRSFPIACLITENIE